MIWAAFTVLVLIAAVADARSYRIPNWISLALAGLFVIALTVAVAMNGQPIQDFWPHILTGAAILALGYALYQFTGMGAGDAKLAAAIGLWVGFDGLYMWTFTLAVAMAMLAFGLIVLRRALPAGISEKTRVFQKGAPVPLGVAIGLSAIAASPWFNRALFGF
ncbi:MAG TPA: prepilin peptidase [Hyphomonadaceae bacterium]|jgi:prepilin peptidase CpaA|nr:prepilin peptidase [Hyphomonadaceae bacterium]